MRYLILALAAVNCTPSDIVPSSPLAARNPSVPGAPDTEPTTPPTEPEPSPWGIGSPIRMVINDDITENVFEQLPENTFCLPSTKTTNYDINRFNYQFQPGIEHLAITEALSWGVPVIYIALEYNAKNITAYRLEMIKTVTDYLTMQNMTRGTHYELDIRTVLTGATTALVIEILSDDISFHDLCDDIYNPF